jgi:Flp pilus assembly protein TadD
MDLTQSIKNYQRAIELEPEYASAHNSLGVAYRETGQTEKAIQSWKKALALRPDVGYPLMNLGMAYLSRGEKTKALDYFYQYKKEHYPSLSQDERAQLDNLIQRCERKQ